MQHLPRPVGSFICRTRLSAQQAGERRPKTRRELVAAVGASCRTDCFHTPLSRNYLHVKAGGAQDKTTSQKSGPITGSNAGVLLADGQSYLPDDDQCRSSLTMRWRSKPNWRLICINADEEQAADDIAFGQRRDKQMKIKHLLSGVAIGAAVAIAGPVWAQNAAPAPAPEPAPGATSATPPIHHHHAVRHARAMHAHHMEMSRKAALTGDTTAQLNREELARIQSGGPPAPPPGAGSGGPAPMPGGPMPPPPAASGGNSMGLPGPNTGGPGLTPYTH